MVKFVSVEVVQDSLLCLVPHTNTIPPLKLNLYKFCWFILIDTHHVITYRFNNVRKYKIYFSQWEPMEQGYLILLCFVLVVIAIMGSWDTTLDLMTRSTD